MSKSISSYVKSVAKSNKTLLAMCALTAASAIGAFNGGSAVVQGPFAIPISTLTEYAPSIGIYGAIISVSMAVWSFAHGKGLSTIGVPIIVLSPQSPLGLKLMGLARDASIEINGVQYAIEEII